MNAGATLLEACSLAGATLARQAPATMYDDAPKGHTVVRGPAGRCHGRRWGRQATTASADTAVSLHAGREGEIASEWHDPGAASPAAL
jgi:hypothetical protein